MKALILALTILCVVLTMSGCNRPVESKTPTPAPRLETEISPAFREQAQRALDAIERVPEMGSLEYPHVGFDVRELDAEKAIAEAKYKASTVKDKEILDVLGAALYGRTAVERRPLLDPDHMTIIRMGDQCTIELIGELDPGKLSEAGLTKANAKTCLTQERALLDKWEQKLRKQYQ